jgi:hypothetical protein
MMPNSDQPPEQDAAFLACVEAAFARHLTELRWAEIARALTALSNTYVHRRQRGGEALDGRGKRAAFTLYYAPRHFVMMREVVRGVAAGAAAYDTLVDLGCGTGSAGAAWSLARAPHAAILGVDTQAWALGEAARLYRALAVPGRTVRTGIEHLRWPRGRLGIVAAFTVNELVPAARARLQTALAARIATGDALLVVEPLARAAAPWWDEWSAWAGALGGRSDTWRFEVALPPQVAALGHSAGLDPRELGCRSLWIAPAPQRL